MNENFKFEDRVEQYMDKSENNSQSTENFDYSIHTNSEAILIPEGNVESQTESAERDENDLDFDNGFEAVQPTKKKMRNRKLRPAILNILSDGQEHNADEIAEKCKDYLCDSGTKGDIRSPIYLIMSDLRKRKIISSNYGVYRLKDSDTSTDFETSMRMVKKELEKYKNFSWVNCSEKELRKAQIFAKQMVELKKEIDAIFF